MSVRDVESGKEIFSVKGPVRWVDWSPDGDHLAAVTRGSISIFDRSGNEIDEIVIGSGSSFARFSPDGRLIAAIVDVADPRLRIWNWERSEIVQEILDVHGEGIEFDPTGEWIATDGEGRPEIWDVETGELITRLPDIPAAIYAFAFNPDGSQLAVGSSDQAVRSFDTASGEDMLVLNGHRATVNDVVFSLDGSMMASRDDDGVVRVWALDIDDLLEIARREVTRSLTDEECRQFLHLERCPD